MTSEDREERTSSEDEFERSVFGAASAMLFVNLIIYGVFNFLENDRMLYYYLIVAGLQNPEIEVVTLFFILLFFSTVPAVLCLVSMALKNRILLCQLFIFGFIAFLS